MIEGLIEDSDTIEGLRDKYNKKYRKSVEQEWSLNKIIVNMAKHDEETFGKFISLTYTYMLGSNLVHMDAVAVNMIRERASRNSLRRDSVEINHIFRLISTLLNLVMVKMIGDIIKSCG